MTDRETTETPRGTVRLGYVNHEDRFAVRTLLPTGRMVFGKNQWHPFDTWLIEARDMERPEQDPRLYSFNGFLCGTPAARAAAMNATALAGPENGGDVGELAELAELSRKATQGLAEFKVVSHPIPESGDADLPGMLYLGGVEVATVHEKYGSGNGAQYEADGALFAEAVNAYRSGRLVYAPKAEPDPNSWEANVEVMLAGCPHTIRCHEGGGPEDLKMSLVLTFGKMKAMIAASPSRQNDGEQPVRIAGGVREDVPQLWSGGGLRPLVWDETDWQAIFAETPAGRIQIVGYGGSYQDKRTVCFPLCFPRPNDEENVRDTVEDCKAYAERKYAEWWAPFAAAPQPPAPEGTAAGEPVPDRNGMDGTGRLCRALYGRKEKAGDYIGGSDARMLHDAADRIEANASPAQAGGDEIAAGLPKETRVPQPLATTAPASGGSAVAVEEVERLARLALSVGDAAWSMMDDAGRDEVDDKTSVLDVFTRDCEAVDKAFNDCEEEPKIEDNYARVGWVNVRDKLLAAISRLVSANSSARDGALEPKPIMWRRRGKFRWFYQEHQPSGPQQDQWLPLYDEAAIRALRSSTPTKATPGPMTSAQESAS